jgi:hypothetical protein
MGAAHLQYHLGSAHTQLILQFDTVRFQFKNRFKNSLQLQNIGH